VGEITIGKVKFLRFWENEYELMIKTNNMNIMLYSEGHGYNGNEFQYHL
jgi:hypothetical protein